MKQRLEHSFFGVGVEWAEALEEGIKENLEKFSCFELIPENFFKNKRDTFLKVLRDSNIPVLIHAVEISIGSDEPLKQKHLDQILRVADQVNTVNISDHLSMTEAQGTEIGQLTPLPWTQEVCDVVCRKIEKIQSQIKVPFLIENVTNRFLIPNPDFSETEFINQILHRTGCHLLLDLHNIHTNAFNFGFDPFQWLGEIDLNAVAGIHIAGGIYDHEGMMIDSHSRKAPERVWELYRLVCSQIRPACTIVEWTDEPPPIEALINEVDIAESILESRVQNVEPYYAGASV